jgi:hypothetical protein
VDTVGRVFKGKQPCFRYVAFDKHVVLTISCSNCTQRTKTARSALLPTRRPDTVLMVHGAPQSPLR